MGFCYNNVIVGGSVKEEFIKKYNNHEYISNDLYLNVLANYSSAVPSNFNIDTYNDIVLEKLYKIYIFFK